MKSVHVTDSIKENIYNYVRADLQPSRAVVHGKVGFSVMLGGLVSLFLCGQLGFGLTALAMKVHTAMMEAGGFLGCTVVCGILFAVVPVLTLRALSTGIQFLVLIRREWRAIAGWTLVFGSLLAYQNDRSDSLWVILLWALAAIASFELFARALHKISVQMYRVAA